MSALRSSFAVGHTYHRRVLPHKHDFRYAMYYGCIDLSELVQVKTCLRAASKLPALRFNEQDYFGQGDNLLEKAQQRLAQFVPQYQPKRLQLLCQLRCWGHYFSPVNFLLASSDEHGEVDYVLAEVTNTPWGEKHYYCLNVSANAPHAKDFHVSPFNPMDMHYYWHFHFSLQRSELSIDCRRKAREFVAGIALEHMPLTAQSVRHVLRTHPCMTWKIKCAIYWQALLLALKRTPFYPHPKQLPRNSNEHY